jgi:SAM-dependent methyltransferase
LVICYVPRRERLIHKKRLCYISCCRIQVKDVTSAEEGSIAAAFPQSSSFDRDWMIANSMGPNAIWLTEYLSAAMSLQPGMKVLDLGCGKAMSSIFLARIFGVEVWACDLWIAADENRTRIAEAGLSEQIHAVNSEAHVLPFAPEEFDAIVSIDAYHYFGTDDLYLGYVLQFLKPGGQIGFVSPGLAREFAGDPPEHLHVGWYSEFASFHSAQWWRRHWERSGKVDVLSADWLTDGWRLWAHWNEVCADTQEYVEPSENEMLKADAGRNLGFVRLVAERRKAGRWL